MEAEVADLVTAAAEVELSEAVQEEVEVFRAVEVGNALVEESLRHN